MGDSKGLGPGGRGGKRNDKDGEQEGRGRFDDEGPGDFASHPMVALVESDRHKSDGGSEPSRSAPHGALTQGEPMMAKGTAHEG